MKKFKTLSREEFKVLIATPGVRVTNAFLYEPDQNPQDEFVFVQLGKDLCVFKRVWRSN